MNRTLKKIATALAVVLLLILVYYAYDLFRDKSREEKLATIIHREDRRELSRTLTNFLEDKNPDIRARAALAVGRIGGEKAAGRLFEMLTDESIDVAATAAFGIGISGHKALAARLAEEANRLPAAVAARAVVAAGRLSDSTQLETNLKLSSYTLHPSPDVREAACYAVYYANAKPEARVVASLRETESDSLVRIAALFTLARLGANEGTPLFIEYLADPDPYARALAVRGLAKSTAPEALHYLQIALNDDNPHVAAQAVASIRTRNTIDAAGHLAGKLTQTKNENLQMEILTTLQGLKAPHAIDQARSIFLGSPSVAVVAASIKYIAAIEQDRAIATLDSLAVDTLYPRIRAATAEAYGIIGGDGIIPRLSVMLADEDPLVRYAAFTALGSVDSGNVDFFIRKALADPDYVVVSYAIDQIKEKKKRDYLPALLALMKQGNKIEDDLRRGILDAAAAFLDTLQRDSIAHEILLAGALDPSYTVRKDAAAVYQDKLNETRHEIIRQPVTRISPSKLSNSFKKYAAENPRATVVTSKGQLEIELLLETAPLTVLNFMELAEDGFYDGLIFHRVVPNFVIQGGDPRGDGWGGPGYSIRCEYSPEPYQRGTVGIATSGKDTGGSQFFITHSPQPHLYGRYTVFGEVTAGIEVIDEIVVGDVIEKVIIQEIHDET